MDGLSAAASIIAVVQIAQSVGSALRDYYQGVRDARKDINALHSSIKNLELILVGLETLARREKIDLLVLQSPTGVLNQCKSDFAGLESQLALPKNLQGRRGRFLRALKWPFQKAEVQKIVDMIERHKSALSMYLGVQNL
jgi:hypothetical protein